MSSYTNITFAEYLTKDHVSYKLNPRGKNKTGKGFYKDALRKITRQIFIMTEYYSKVLYLRFDLHLFEYTKSNEPVTKLMREFKRKLKARWAIKNLCYVWCREIFKSNKQHYHFMLGINGHKLKYYQQIITLLKECKSERDYVRVPSNCFYLYDRSKSNSHHVLNKVIYRVSYLAKVWTKEKSNKAAKAYGGSKLKIDEPLRLTIHNI